MSLEEAKNEVAPLKGKTEFDLYRVKVQFFRFADRDYEAICSWENEGGAVNDRYPNRAIVLAIKL